MEHVFSKETNWTYARCTVCDNWTTTVPDSRLSARERMRILHPCEEDDEGTSEEVARWTATRRC